MERSASGRYDCGAAEVARRGEQEERRARRREDCEGRHELRLEIEARSSFRGISSARRNGREEKKRKGTKRKASDAKTVETAIVAEQPRRLRVATTMDLERVAAQTHAYVYSLIRDVFCLTMTLLPSERVTIDSNQCSTRRARKLKKKKKIKQPRHKLHQRITSRKYLREVFLDKLHFETPQL